MSKTVTQSVAFVGLLVGVFFVRHWWAGYTDQLVEEGHRLPTVPVPTYPTFYSPPMVLPPIDTGKKFSPEEKQSSMNGSAS